MSCRVWVLPGPRITGGCVNLSVLLGDSGGERIAALRQAHEDDAEFGYRLLADEARQAGFPMADRTAWRLCQQSGIMSAIVKTRKKPGPPVCDDLVKRNFTAASGMTPFFRSR